MVTLLELKTRARQRADMVSSQFVTDAELTDYINASIAELHDLLIGSYNEDYFMEEVQFTATTAIEYPLPDGTNYSGAPKFYKVRGVDIQVTAQDWVTVKRFNFNRRNEDQTRFAWNLLGQPYMEYRLVGSNIRFNRTPNSNTIFRIFYHPVAPVLALDADEYDDQNQYAEYVVVDAAIKMLNKEESDTSVLLAQKEALKKRITDMAQNRDANEPETVTDIFAEDMDTFWTGR